LSLITKSESIFLTTKYQENANLILMVPLNGMYSQYGNFSVYHDVPPTTPVELEEQLINLK
jgi:hypothetical protein